MKFQVEIDIMPLKELLDPQGKAVEGSFANLQLTIYWLMLLWNLMNIVCVYWIPIRFDIP